MTLGACAQSDMAHSYELAVQKVQEILDKNMEMFLHEAQCFLKGSFYLTLCDLSAQMYFSLWKCCMPVKQFFAKISSTGSYCLVRVQPSFPPKRAHPDVGKPGLLQTPYS